jgi:hypothetical protein
MYSFTRESGPVSAPAGQAGCALVLGSGSPALQAGWLRTGSSGPVPKFCGDRSGTEFLRKLSLGTGPNEVPCGFAGWLAVAQDF